MSHLVNNLSLISLIPASCRAFAALLLIAVALAGIAGCASERKIAQQNTSDAIVTADGTRLR